MNKAILFFTIILCLLMKGDATVVTIETNLGNIVVELNDNKAPLTVENFLNYVDQGFYNGTIFHRVIDGFMVQGGGFTPDLEQKKTRPSIKNEAANGLKNERGTIAMARTSAVDSATAQFFINVVDNSNLNYKSSEPHLFGYCVFGKVVDGMDVVDKIKGVPTGNQGVFSNVPKQPVEIKTIRRS